MKTWFFLNDIFACIAFPLKIEVLHLRCVPMHNFMRNFLKLFGLRTVNRNYFVLKNETKYSIISINY